MKYSNEEPLRAELFNTDQLEQHGKYLAKTHVVRTGKAPDRLLKRLADNEKILAEVRSLLAEAVKEDTLVTPAGEWLLDNFYLIEDHIRTGKRHLPKGYSEVLPGVSDKDMIIKLLAPAFDKSAANPGYIKGYVPGIRENGGQYTHAAIWMIMAHAKTGNAARAWELMDIINPINHADNPDKVEVYKAEPYVVAADVYSVSPNNGRGGWTWYTGSAGWMYQLIIEWLLGIRIEAGKLRLKPCIPKEWKSFSVNYRYLTSNYHIVLSQGSAVRETDIMTIDGDMPEDGLITLFDDGAEHSIEILLSGGQ